ncbi:MAG: hypothetical protein ACJAZO_002827 [Myxococcota bacterium]|jgi:hypothetical protein
MMWVHRELFGSGRTDVRSSSRPSGPSFRKTLFDDRYAPDWVRPHRGRTLQLEAAGDAVVEYKQTHKRGQLLAGQVVANDASKAHLPVLPGEAIFLTRPAKVGRDHLGSGPAAGGDVGRDKLHLPPVELAASLWLVVCLVD